jgi:phosphoesterase RecJ-like protein
MRAILRELGREATACIYDAVPARYQFLIADEPMLLLGQIPAAELDAFDGVVIMDTCSWTQIEPAAAFLRTTRLPKLVVDHHATRDDLDAGGPPTLYLIDEQASATCTMLFEWARAMDWPLSPAAVAGLFAGIVTDTGWFRFPSTDPRTLQAAAALIADGIRPDVMFARLMDSYSLARTRLLALALGAMQLVAGGRVAITAITPPMFAQAGANATDTEDIVNEPLRAQAVMASVLLIDLGDGKIRVNFRSKSPEIAGCEIDVAAIASQFGGGGHRRAAGARVSGTLEQVAPQVIGAITQAVESAAQTGEPPQT